MYEDDKSYRIALAKYYITLIVFNLIIILTLSGIAYIIGNFTFFIFGSIIINSIRPHMPTAYHCKHLWCCAILTNILFLIGGIIVIPPILAYIGSLILMVILYQQHTTKPIWVNLVLCALTFAMGTNEIRGAIFMSILFVLILQKREGDDLDG
ncbi:MAG: accessory gene regulator B family protein [Sarcina sp.]